MAFIPAGLRPPPPIDPGPEWPGVTSMTWTVGDVTLDLIDPTQDGVMLLRDGVRGLNMPPVERYTSQSPAISGTRWRGYRTQERGGFWPLLVWTRTGYREWQDIDARLWSTLRPDVVGEWTVGTDRTGTRKLRCRYSGDGDHTYAADPLKTGWTVYGIELVAEEPYWVGGPISSEWSAANGGSRGFLPGPPFFIGTSSTVDTATMTNPGDIPAFPVWTVTGPTTNAKIGFRIDHGGGVIDRAVTSIPFPIADGETLTIDTRPHEQTAILTGTDGTLTDRTGELGPETAFRAMPSGKDVTLELGVQGTGKITATIEPRYWRAFS